MKRSRYIRIKNILHKQSEKACTLELATLRHALIKVLNLRLWLRLKFVRAKDSAIAEGENLAYGPILFETISFYVKRNLILDALY